MRSGYTWFWCCALLIAICTTASGGISADGRQAIEQLRLKHLNAEVEHGKSNMRELAELLRKKSEVERPVEPPAVLVPPVTAEIVSPVATRDQALPEDTADQAVDSAPTNTNEIQKPVVQAERYDHEPADTSPQTSSMGSAAAKRNADKKSNDFSFGSFLAAIFICMALLQFGAGLIGAGNTAKPGCSSIIGLILICGGVVVAILTITSFWPLLLILAFGAIFGQSKSSGNDGCCGCGCMAILIFLLFGLIF